MSGQSPRDLEKLLKKLEWTVIRRLDGLSRVGVMKFTHYYSSMLRRN